jgi:hypothetical protein
LPLLFLLGGFVAACFISPDIRPDLNDDKDQAILPASTKPLAKYSTDRKTVIVLVAVEDNDLGYSEKNTIPLNLAMD